jgi:HemY protein
VSALVWTIGLFAAAVGLALAASFNDGYVLIVVAPYRIELSLNFFLCLLALGLLALYAVLRLLAFGLALPAQAQAYRARRQAAEASLVFQDAVRLLFEGRFGQALKKAAQAHAAGTARGLSALIAARAAQRMREPGKLQAWMAHAKDDDPRTEAATLMLEAEMMNEARNFSAALDALERLQASQGRHIAALRLELRARQGLGDWPGVLRLVRQLAKRDALPGDVVREVLNQAHLAQIARFSGDLELLQDYVHDLPAAERSRRVVLAAVKALAALGAEATAEKLIETTLDAAPATAWPSDLLVVYGRLAGGQLTARIARAEAWLLRHPDDANLLMALGRMCIRQRLWGKAQSYLEASLAVRETQEAHLELARLCDQLDRTDAANQHYRASARLDGRPAL